MMQVVKKRKKKKATEGLILAAQEQALRNHSVRIDKTSETSLFRLCGNSTEEYDMHVFSRCMKLPIRSAMKR